MLLLHHSVVLWGTSIQWSFSENGQATFEDKHFENRKKSTFYVFEYRVFFDFQNAYPRKWCDHFRWNSTELKYSIVLQNDGVTAFVLIPTPTFITSENGHFSIFPLWGYHDIGPCSEVKILEIEKSAEAVTPSFCSTMEYFNSVEFQWKWSHHFRGYAFWKSKKIDFLSSINENALDFHQKKTT